MSKSTVMRQYGRHWSEVARAGHDPEVYRETGMCPIRPVESGVSWSSGGVNGQRHIHISAELPSVQSFKTPGKERRTPLQVGLDWERPHPSAVTLEMRGGRPQGTANTCSGLKHRETLSFAETTRTRKRPPQSRSATVHMTCALCVD